MNWHRYISRQNVDITTISGVDAVFFDILKAKEGEHFFTHIKNKTITHYTDLNFDEIGKDLYDNLFNKDQIKTYYGEGKTLLKRIKKSTRYWQKKLTSSAQKDFSLAFSEFKSQVTQINAIFSITSFIAIEAWQKDCERTINSCLKRHDLKDEEIIKASIYKPWKETALLEIQAKLKQGTPAAQLQKEYAFLRSWTLVWYKDLDEAWFKSLKQNNQPNVYPLSKIKKLLSPTENEEKFIDLAPYMTFFKDWRDDLRRKHAHGWSFLFTKIAEKWNIQREEIGYLTLTEIEELMNSGMGKAKIERRKNNELIFSVTSKIITLYDEKIPEKYLKIIKTTQSHVGAAQVTGICAYPGIISGPVRIVRSYHDIKKVNECDILLANTTHPDYLPAMQRAAAFVTNEGGMLSHAAIVAREMKKPCIVGTKSATDIFKDGDIVEVDATNGNVRIKK